MNKEEFSKLVDEIINKGYDEATAAKFAAIIGDTPMVDEVGNIVVIEDGKELTRLKLDFFGSKKNGQLINQAIEAIQKDHPEWQESMSSTPILNDKGNLWEITFKLPDSVLGGVPIVEIDKGSLKVIRIYHTQ